VVECYLFIIFFFFFFFFFFFSSRRRHTRSKRDWSSDVCSSDLLIVKCSQCRLRAWPRKEGYQHRVRNIAVHLMSRRRPANRRGRSEERRVGKECRWRWAADQGKKKEKRRRGEEEREIENHLRI